jgi:thiamine pyrophosphate-dependent acetolactate synthase large subunit-like protein
MTSWPESTRYGNRDRVELLAQALKSQGVEAIALLTKSERPLILGGSGVWWSDGAAGRFAQAE